jgi:hypothetical protein
MSNYFYIEVEQNLHNICYPSKSAKYEIKVWWICDAENYYPFIGQIYTGKASTGRETNQGKRVNK